MTAMSLFALRLGRWGIAGFGGVAFLVTLLQAAGFYQVAGRTELRPVACVWFLRDRVRDLGPRGRERRDAR